MQLIDTTTPLTMTSREIADYTGKEHDNVRRDIRIMAEELSLSFEEKVEPSTGGRPSKVFLLPKRETLILVSGYSVTMRAKIIDRWQELEAKQAPVIPMTLAGALRLALAQAEELEAKTLEVAAQALRIEHLKPAAAVGAMVAKHRHTLDQVARTFPGVDSIRIKKCLALAGYLYRVGGTGPYRAPQSETERCTASSMCLRGLLGIFSGGTSSKCVREFKLHT